jgi:hypothetical protein
MPTFSDITSGIGQKWNELDPILKTTLLGAGAAGLAGGVGTALSKSPDTPEGRSERRKRITRNALVAALLGGGAAAGIGYGAKSIGESMPAGQKTPSESLGDSVRSPLGRLGMAGGAFTGAMFSKKIRESGAANDKALSLAARLAGAFDDKKDVRKDPRDYISKYFGQESDAGVRARAFAALRKRPSAVSGVQTIRDAISAGIDVHPLERAGVSPGTLETGLSSRKYLKHIAPALRRMGTKAPIIGGLAAISPEIFNAGKGVVSAITGSGEEGNGL